MLADRRRPSFRCQRIVFVRNRILYTGVKTNEINIFNHIHFHHFGNYDRRADCADTDTAADSCGFVRLANSGCGRTARLSVVHAPPLTASPTTGASARYSVRADFDVYSVRSDGSVRFLRRQSREATIAAGEGLTLDYTASAGDGSVRVASTVYMQRLGETESPDLAPSVNVSL